MENNSNNSIDKISKLIDKAREELGYTDEDYLDKKNKDIKIFYEFAYNQTHKSFF